LQHSFFKNLDEEPLEENENKASMPNDIDCKSNEISQQISTISMADKENEDIDVMDYDEKKTENKNNTKMKRNTYCEMILQEWGLEDISDILQESGWSDPNQWHQLTHYVLEYEIGLTQDQSLRFMQKYHLQFETKKKQKNQHRNNNNNLQQQMSVSPQPQNINNQNPRHQNQHNPYYSNNNNQHNQRNNNNNQYRSHSNQRHHARHHPHSQH